MVEIASLSVLCFLVFSISKTDFNEIVDKTKVVLFYFNSRHFASGHQGFNTILTRPPPPPGGHWTFSSPELRDSFSRRHGILSGEKNGQFFFHSERCSCHFPTEPHLNSCNLSFVFRVSRVSCLGLWKMIQAHLVGYSTSFAFEFP